MPISTSSDVSEDESNDEKSSPLTAIVVMPNSTPSGSIVPSVETNNEVINQDEATQPFLGKRKSVRMILMADVSHRLTRRKVLLERLHRISNVMCFLGMLGVIFMIIDNEINFTYGYGKESNASWILKITITITTIILVGFVFYFHRVSLSLYAVNNSLDNWRMGLTVKKIFLILLEAFICAIHPIPRHLPFIENRNRNDSTISHPISLSYIDMDVALGLPMFARIYLLCRFILFHSHLLHDASSQSLGCLNRVSINFHFLIKTYLEQWPIHCLFIFSAFLFLIGSWSLRACNYTSPDQHLAILDSMWLFIVTFTTVGYGDLTPSTYCGRSIAAIIGLLGILSTALIISVFTQKLQLTRSEKYVHTFVLNINLAKEHQNQAANVIKFALRVWYLKRKHQPTSDEFIMAQRRLFRSIHFNKQLKEERKQLIDNCVGLPEIITMQRDAIVKTGENIQQSIRMKSKVDQIEEKLGDMDKKMMDIQNTLNLLLDRIS